jgi:subtilase family serine protease
MKCTLAASLAGLVIAFGSAQADTLSGHVAGWVEQANEVGSAPDESPVVLSVYLNFTNKAALDSLVAAQTTKGNPLYGQFLTPGQFRTRFAPPASSVAAVEKALRGWGFTVGREPASRFYIEAVGTVAQVKAAFLVSQNLYSYQGLTLRANAENPTVPASIAATIAYIGGLDDSELLIHPFHATPDQPSSVTASANASSDPNAPPPVAAAAPPSHCDTYWGDLTAAVSAAPTPYPAALPWLNCGYTPLQIQVAYGVDNVGLDGTGVRVAITDAYASPTILADANMYSANHGLPRLNSSNFTQVVQPDIYNLPAPPKDRGLPSRCGVQGWFTEETLDVEAVHAIAPGATIIYVGAQSCSTPLTDVLYDTIDEGRADIITSSWGNTGEAYKPTQRLVAEVLAFEQAAAQGISILFSSGDNGDESQALGIAEADSPASNPFVTAVGGTTLALYNSSGKKDEWGWGTYRGFFSGVSVSGDGTTVTDTGLGAFSFYAGAGGGPSFFFLQPAYQASVVPSALATTTYLADGTPMPLGASFRVVPDVAMDADPYSGFLIGETYTIAGNPISDFGCVPESTTLEYCEGGIGGTSLASPLFAGVLALINQQRFANHLSAIGFANPALYQLTIGTPGSTTTPLVDVQAPASPVAVLRGYLANPTELRLVTVNSVPDASCPAGVCEGLDDLFLLTTSGYDNVTGLGTPYVPALIKALGGP